MEEYDGDARHHDADDVRAARPQMNTATWCPRRLAWRGETPTTVLMVVLVAVVKGW